MSEWAPFVATLLAQAVIVALYLAKQRADDRRRWHDKRLELYTEFTSSFAGFTGLALDRLDDTSLDPAKNELKVLDANLRHAHFQMQLLSTPEVAAAAESVLAALGLVFFAQHKDKEFWTHYQEAFRALDIFHAAARRELGVVPSESRPPGS